ncbi:hypothetical protein H634G_11092 [Metarhizium anisopliae BRIP 53293]|uniref:Uncharacterized protein n=1 Tax=Metarhizium anisopliae BRIP 53293 TaxID=1291518 RepID=A0A0D9NHY4_METAN|nr:hypothetical protein H634G_11092 [Metarhizium anisopliae BRIP 53293]
MNNFGLVTVVTSIGLCITVIKARAYVSQQNSAAIAPKRRAIILSWAARVLIDFAASGLLLGFMWTSHNLDFGSWALTACIWLNMLEEIVVFFQVAPGLLHLFFSPSHLPITGMADPKLYAAVAVVLAVSWGSALLLLSQLLPPGVTSTILSIEACTGHRILIVVGFVLINNQRRAEFFIVQILPIVFIALSHISISEVHERIHQQLILTSALIAARVIPPALREVWEAAGRVLWFRKGMVEQSSSQITLVTKAKIGGAQEAQCYGSTV